MRSTHKYSAHSSHWTNSRFVPVKGCRTLWDVSPNPPGKHLGGKSISEHQDIFADQTSAPVRTMNAEIERVARCPFNILITGETGTGKTRAAREIHRRSARADKPLLELNCANLPEQLVEAELFGYRKGAFTGADHDRVGLFEEANGGILFLDEIGDVAPTVQNRLLKAIDEKQIKRLGNNHYTFCDVQIIAATSRDLPKMIEVHQFREDLYCRLAVLTLETIPLRNRREEIPSMVALFLREASEAIGARANASVTFVIEDAAVSQLSRIEYPGNIRALRNLVFELTSYVNQNEVISTELVQFVLNKSSFQEDGRDHGPDNCDAETSEGDIALSDRLLPHQVALDSLAKEGDIILPLQLCVLRRDETFRQWTARAKRYSIEAARMATGGSMRTAAARLGLSRNSLIGHLHRARQVQNQNLFDWEEES